MTRRLGPHEVEEAARLLRAGELVAFPTETVYGLGADARNGRAVAAVFEAKGRPHFNPLICHFPDAEAAFAEVIDLRGRVDAPTTILSRENAVDGGSRRRHPRRRRWSSAAGGEGK